MKNEVLFTERQSMGLMSRLEMSIKEDGVYVRFLPFQVSFKKYEWREISTAFVRTYNPISEYGGWGYRFVSFGHGKALTVMGNKGIQLVLNDGTKLLIGTRKRKEAAQILKELGYFNPNDFL